MKQNRRRKKRRGSNRGVGSICFIVMILLVSLSVQSHGLKEKLNVYAAQKEELQQKIDSETWVWNAGQHFPAMVTYSR